VAPGTLELPATLRYQACDEVACYAPARLQVSFSLPVAKAAGSKQHEDVFTKNCVWHRRAAEDRRRDDHSVPVLPAATGRTVVATDDLAALDGFACKASAFGYLGPDDFLTFIHNAENGIKEKGMFEGRGPSGHLWSSC
jgi:hypothetical protein